MRCIAASALMLASCFDFDAMPRLYLEGLKPDLYFAVPLPRNTTIASVNFATAKLKPGEVPQDIRVLTWNDEGDNIYAGTLGDTELRAPVEMSDYLKWTGAAVFPYSFSGPAPAQWLGVETRPLYWFRAYEPRFDTGGHCQLDLMGQGIYGCGTWLDALIALWAQCRGELGNLIDCWDVHTVVAPAVEVFALGQGPGVGQDMADTTFAYWMLGDHVFVHDARGWRHATLPPRKWNEPLDLDNGSIPWAGPFATAAEAARDAAPDLDPVWILFTRDSQVPDPAMRALAAALTDELSAQARKR